MSAALLLFQNEVGQLLAASDPVAQIVLVILLVFSVVSWAVIFKKYRSFKEARRASVEFLRVFRASKKLSEIKAAAESLRASPLVDVFLNGYREIEGQVTYSENPGKPRAYFWNLANLAGQTLRVALVDEDKRPGCHVWCSGFRLIPNDLFEPRLPTALLFR